MALVDIETDRDPWIFEHESCERLQRDIMALLNQRSRELKNTYQYSAISATIRQRMKQYHTEVAELAQKNHTMFSKQKITSEEYERRFRQVEVLQSKDMQMQTMFLEYAKPDGDRNALLGATGVRDMGTVQWGTDDDDVPPLDASDPSTYTIEDIQNQQQRIFQEQEEGLNQLSQIVSRQKDIATTMYTEIDTQNDIIEDLTNAVDRTGDRVINDTQQIRIVGRKDSTWGYWIIIIILFVANIIVYVL